VIYQVSLCLFWLFIGFLVFSVVLLVIGFFCRFSKVLFSKVVITLLVLNFTRQGMIQRNFSFKAIIVQSSLQSASSNHYLFAGFIDTIFFTEQTFYQSMPFVTPEFIFCSLYL